MTPRCLTETFTGMASNRILDQLINPLGSLSKPRAICTINGKVKMNVNLEGAKDETHITIKYEKDPELKDIALPFHIHVNKVVSDDCQSTQGHYDPNGLEANPNYNCNPDNLKTCSHGDLANKIGKLNGPNGNYHYVDRTITNFDDLIGRSIVVHKPDKSRIGCCTIQKA